MMITQMMLSELLSSAGSNFQAVVGHPSAAEIAAAYAVSYIIRQDAVKIA